MTDSPLATLVSLRLGQAEEAIAEAKLLAEANHLRGSVNRSYYAMFYAVQALLAQSGYQTTKHAGAISLFDRYFVKEGAFDKGFSKRLHRLFDLRQDSDYGVQVEATVGEAEEDLDHAQRFVQAARTFLERQKE